MSKIILSVFLIISLGGFSFLVDRNTHEVRPGDTLFSISQQYDVSVDEIQDWNNLDGTSIEVGQDLYIEPAQQETDVIDEDRQELTHTVSAGETLFSISRVYDVDVDEIMDWNELESTNLSVGQDLTVYSTRESAAEVDHTEDTPELASDPTDTAEAEIDEQILAEAAEETEYSTHQIHTVRRSETLYRIASQYNMSVDEVLGMNEDLDRPEDLSAGQQIKVRNFITMPSVLSEEQDVAPQGAFYTYRYTGSEPLEEILGYNQMDKSEFRALNPGIDADNLESGDLLTLIAPGTETVENPYRVSSSANGTLEGLNVSVYDDDEIGSSTTNGDLYNPEHLTAAHARIPMETIVYLENPANGKGVFVLINDRITGSGIKVSQAVKDAIDLATMDTQREVLLSQID